MKKTLDTIIEARAQFIRTAGIEPTSLICSPDLFHLVLQSDVPEKIICVRTLPEATLYFMTDTPNDLLS